jgi:hypothetical protein
MINFSITVDFDRNFFLLLMIKSTNDLSKAAFAKHTFDFKSEKYMIACFDNQVSLVVVGLLRILM